MPRLFSGQTQTHGLLPGKAVHVGRKKIEHAQISVIRYAENHLEEKRPRSIAECPTISDPAVVTWINIDGLHQVEILEELGERFGFHPLVVEDILNTGQRPKMEDYGEYLFVVLKSLYHARTESEEPEIEQISLIVGPNYVFSFQERTGDEFEPIRDRIRNSKGRVRRMGADYLAYSLVDMIVDTYFLVLERLGERMETLEEALVTTPTTETLQTIHQMKREMVFLRKATWPLREVIGAMERGESSLIQATTSVYLRDVYDHTIQVIDAVETYRDMLSGMLDIYLSSISNRMNEIMKVLTIISTVFIPLTFVAGVYGMNFRYMPELEQPWAYPLVWLAMIAIAGLMLAYFRRKRWL